MSKTYLNTPSTETAPALAGPDSAVARSGPDGRPRAHRLAAMLHPQDRFTLVLAVLLAGAWLSEGARTLLGLPHASVGVVDAAEAVICVWLAVRLVRERQFRLLLVTALFVAWVLTGLIGTPASKGSIALALKDSLLLPVFAVVVWTRGCSEHRARVVAYTLLALCGFEFLLTLLQLVVVPYASSDPDLIVGSFGASNNAVTGVVILLTATVGLAAYLTGVRRGGWVLAAVCLLPVFSIWAFVKVATVVFPGVALVVALTALLLRRTSYRRAGIAVLAALISSGVVIGGYAIVSPMSFSAITSASGFNTYLSTGSTAAARLPRGVVLGNVLVLRAQNSEVLKWQRPGTSYNVFRVLGIQRGTYSVLVVPDHTLQARVSAGTQYGFSASLAGASTSTEVVQAQLEWLGPTGRPVGTVKGTQVSLSGFQSSDRRVTVYGAAPGAAAYGIGKLTLLNAPGAGSSFFIVHDSWQFNQTAQIRHAVAHNFGNAQIYVAQRPGVREPAFRIVSVRHGPYAAWLTGNDVARIKVRPGRAYGFVGGVGGATAVTQTIQPEVEWLNRQGRPLRQIVGHSVRVSGFQRGLYPVAVGGVAPHRAAYELPKIVVVNDPPSGSSIFLSSLSFHYRPRAHTTPRVIRHRRSSHPRSPAGRRASRPHRPRLNRPPSHRTPSHRTPSHRPQRRHSAVAVTPTAPPSLPQGHIRLLKLALHTVSGPFTTELFGNGLGYATVAAHLGAGESHFSVNQLAASMSDFGRLLAERGWTGVALVAVLALLLVVLAFRAARSLPPGRWSTAFAVAVPAATVVILGYGLIAADLAQRPTAITFWLIIALGLAPARAVASPDGAPGSKTNAASGPDSAR